jgi:hypothetical protein
MRLRVAPSWWLLLALGAMTMVTPAVVAAAAAKLTGGTVTPTTGTTSTVFHYSVHFVGSTTEQAISVRASVAGSLISLTLTTGRAENGTWTGSSTLPVGSWTVAYQATSTSGTVPPFTVPGQVVVTAPTPTPSPTSAPTPLPTPRPTAAPRPTPKPTPGPTAGPPTATPGPGSSATQAVSPTPFGTTLIGASGLPSSSQSGGQSPSPDGSPGPSPSSAGAGLPGSRPLNVPVEGVVAIGLLGAVTLAAALGERRRRRAVEAFRAQEAIAGQIVPPGSDLEGGSAGNAVDDETVATIEYESPEWTDLPDR